MELPVDPTTADTSAEATLRAIESQELLAAALQATEIDADGSWERDRLIDELSPVDRERLANQVRYAAPQHIHYFRLSGFERLTASALDDLVDDSSYGVQLRAVDELFERAYLVLSVPDGGAQSQLSISESNRHTTVATFDYGLDTVAIRAPTVESAAVTTDRLVGVGPIDSAKRRDFLDPEFLTALESDILKGYNELTLATCRETADTDQINLSSDASATDSNLLEDNVVRSLLNRPDTQRASARGILNPNDSENFRPSVNIDFANSVIQFRTATPESAMISVDRAIQSL